MNWAIPSAPAGLTAFGSKRLSFQISRARKSGDRFSRSACVRIRLQMRPMLMGKPLPGGSASAVSTPPASTHTNPIAATIFVAIVRAIGVRSIGLEGVEAVVEADLDRLRALRDVLDRAGKVEAVGAEVHVIVLDLGRPVGRDAVFHATADEPTAARLRKGDGKGRSRSNGVVFIYPCTTALQIGQDVVERITDASADRGDPVHVDAASIKPDDADRRPVRIGGAPLALDAQHPIVDLIVEAGLDAAENAAVVRMDLAAGHGADHLDPVLV